MRLFYEKCALAFVMVYVMGLIIDALAPTFNGQKSQPNALKLAVYSMTPAWLAGIFSLICSSGLAPLRYALTRS